MAKFPYKALIVCLALVGCSSSPGASPEPGGAATSGAPASSTQAAASPTSTTPTAEPTGPAARCARATNPAVKYTSTELSVGDSSVSYFTVGEGTTAAIGLHQTNGTLCDFLPMAESFTDIGAQLVLTDLCGYGSSKCSPELKQDPAKQIAAVADEARKQGAKRVVLVGTSIGGSYAVLAAKAAKADAIIDLSGPREINGAHITTDASNVTMPALFIFSKTDATDLAAVKAALPSMPANDKKFIEAEKGHGWDFFSNPELVKEIQAWVKGDYSG